MKSLNALKMKIETIIAFDIHGVLFKNDYWHMAMVFLRSPHKYRAAWYGLNPLVWFWYVRFARQGFIFERRIALLVEKYPRLRPCVPLSIAIANAQKPQACVINLVKKLYNTGYELHIVSNIGDGCGADLRRVYPAIFSYFSTFYTPSAAHGYKSKRHERFFQQYQSECALRGQRVIIIDDSKANIQTAQRCGLVGIYYADTTRLKADLMAVGITVSSD